METTRKAALKGSGGPKPGQGQETESIKKSIVNPDDCQQKILVTYWQDVSCTWKKEATSPWPEFVEWLPSVPRQPVKENSPLIKFARFGETRTDKGCLRHDANMFEVTGVEGDVDNGVISFDEAVERLEKHHVKAVVVSSHSYAPDNQRYRILTPLSKPCKPEAREKYVAILNGIMGGNLGPESFNLSQSYFIGGSHGGEYRVKHTFDDPDEAYCLDEPELDDLIQFAVYPEKPQKGDKPTTGKMNADMQTAYDAGLNPQHQGGGKWHLLCPWRNEHTKETAESATTYFEPHTGGYAGGGFKCFHSHCQARGIDDFRRFLGIEGGTTWEHEIPLKDLISAAYDGQKGCAELFIRLNKSRFVYDHAADQWYEFQDHFWTRETLGRTVRALDEIQGLFDAGIAALEAKVTRLQTAIEKATEETRLKKLKQELKSKQGQIKALRKISDSLNTLNFRKQVIEFAAQGADSLGVSGDEWDRNPWILGCTNGIIDLKTGELRSGKPDDYIKTACPTAYEPSAEHPEFFKFLCGIFNDDAELIDFAQIVFGMALLGNSFLKQYLIILSGKGRNGKDTLLSIIGHVLGDDLAGPIASEMLLDNGSNGRRSASGPSADIMRLRGLRLAWATETSDGRRFDAGVAKQLTGGGQITGRPPYGRYQITFEQSHLICILTNNRPHAPVDDYAFWQRIKNIPFTMSFVDDPQAENERQKDPHVLEKVRHEAPGILNWLVQGCLRYQKHGLQEPEAVKQATAEYRRDEDLLIHFIEDACFIGPDAKVKAKNLYEGYKRWAKFNNHRPLSGTMFGRRMGGRFHKETTRNGVFYSGIGLSDDYFKEYQEV